MAIPATPSPSAAPPARAPRRDLKIAVRPLFDPSIVKRAFRDALLKLDPRRMIRNPVMFVVEVGSLFTTILFLHAVLGDAGEASPGFIGAISLWLWFTVLF